MNCSDSKFPEISHFFNQHDSSFGRHVNVKAKKLKRGLSQNQEPIRSESCMDITFQLFLYIMKVKSQEDQLFCSLNFSDVI